MLKPFPLFGDHCILPMERELRIFGEAQNGAVIRAELIDSSGKILGCGRCVAEAGHFLLLLPAVSFPVTGARLVIQSDTETYTATDVAVGLVFLAGGQSNMELCLCNADEGPDIIAAHDDPMLRWYMVPKISLPEQVQTAEEGCRWYAMTPGSCGEMSGIGYFFAARLRKLLHIPIGIIGCYWGGTSVTAWMDEESLRRTAEGIRYIDEYAKRVSGKSMETWLRENEAFESAFNAWNDKVNLYRAERPGTDWEEIEDIFGKCPWDPPAGPGSPYRPAGLAETMLKRITPAALTGFLYYQGEDDAPRTNCYDLLLECMVRRWRELFRNPTLPFINAQLPMWLDRGQSEDYTWARTRMAQHRAWMDMRNSALTCLIDCGEYNNIHPTDKRTPGERMADEYLALCGDAEAIGRLPPIALDKQTEGDSLIIRTDRPVHATNGPADLFEIAGWDGVYSPAHAVIRNGTRIVLTSEAVPNPVKARYAYVCFAPVHVFGENGLPLRPFEME